MKEKILQNIKTIRESKNLAEEFMAIKMGIGQSTYCKKEKGDHEFTLSEFIMVGKIMEVSIAKLVDLDIAKIINQHNHDNTTGLVEYQNILDDGYKLCIAQNKEEINFLKQQIKNLTEILKHK